MPLTMSKGDEQGLAHMLGVLRQFTRRDPPPETPAADTPPAISAVGRNDNEAGAARLLSAIRTYTGFRSTPTLERKLAAVLRNVPEEEIQALIRRADEGHAQDLITIVEDLTNHETFFFRDTMQLQPLSSELLRECIKYRARTDKTLKLWSAACATGEEAYTLTMLALEALREEGIARRSASGGYSLPPDWQLQVLGTDISRQAIRVAKDACYLDSSFGSFRQMPDNWRQFFIEKRAGPGRYGEQARYLTPHPDVTRHVRFETYNLMSRNPPLLDADIVLCRNVLIYIDVDRHSGVCDMIRRALRPGGIFVPSLVDQIPTAGFRTRWLNRCAFYERR